MANEILKQTAILLTAHPKQQKWWAPVLLSLELYPGPLILSYDDIDLKMIPSEISSRFDCSVATGWPAGELGAGRGELACLKNGFGLTVGLDVDYVLKLGFDEPVWRWRNVLQLIRYYHDLRMDIIDCETRIIFGRPGTLLEIMQVADVIERGPGSAESYWTSSVPAAGFSRKRIDDRQWWEMLLGLIHLQGEYAANVGQPNKWCWQIGELWPRV